MGVACDRSLVGEAVEYADEESRVSQDLDGINACHATEQILGR
jgi:hypothetical protein